MLFSLIILILGSFTFPSFAVIQPHDVDKFVSDDTSCQIPDLYQWELENFYEPKTYVPCYPKPHLIKLEKDGDLYFVAIDRSAVPFYANSVEEINCFINNITRGKSSQYPDQEIRQSSPSPFGNQMKLEMSKDVVRVKCYKADNNEANAIYENIFGAYVSYNIKDRGRPLAKDPYNVLMIGLDSISKYSFPKLMPKTYEYLKLINFELLHGYTQLDRVSLPNLIPVLTGYSMIDASIKFGTPLDTYFDIYDFVWYEYRKYGYATIFAEDFSNANTFNRHYKGFWAQPTDYYFRSLSIAADLLNPTTLDKMPHCSGPENGAERILNLASNATTAFRNRPYFGLFWLNSFSHDDYNAPRRMDDRLKQFFEEIYPNLNNTFVFFFSDHGYYKDSVTDDLFGAYESKSPFMFIYVPENFRSKYKEMVKTFERNCHYLVSPYDIYATLQDILLLSGTNHLPTQPKSCQNCKSLFKEISNRRNCRSIEVDPEWCICWMESLLRNPYRAEGYPKREDASIRSGTIRRKESFFLFIILFFFWL